MFQILAVVFIALFIQGILSFFQMKNYKAAADRLRKIGRIGIGTQKRSFGSGAIVILATDPNQVIIAGEIMKGMSVFSKFVDFPDLNGKTLKRAKNELTKKLEGADKFESSKLIAALGAVQMLLDSYNKQNQERYQDKKKPVEPEVFEEDLVGGQGQIVEAQITEEFVPADDTMEDAFEGYEDFDDFAEPQIIDVEEIIEVEETEDDEEIKS